LCAGRQCPCLAGGAGRPDRGCSEERGPVEPGHRRGGSRLRHRQPLRPLLAARPGPAVALGSGGDFCALCPAGAGTRLDRPAVPRHIEGRDRARRTAQSGNLSKVTDEKRGPSGPLFRLECFSRYSAAICSLTNFLASKSSATFMSLPISFSTSILAYSITPMSPSAFCTLGPNRPISLRIGTMRVNSRLRNCCMAPELKAYSVSLSTGRPERIQTSPW